jgi:hypothetical protein
MVGLHPSILRSSEKDKDVSGVTILWVNPPDSGSSRYLTKSIRPHLMLRKCFPVSYLCAHLLLQKGFPVSYLCARKETREQVLPKPLPSAIPARGVRQLGFSGATTRLLIHGQRHLLPLDADRNCTAITFLHRLRSTTSSNALWQLVQMEPPMPSAWDPPLSTSYSHLFVNSWYSCAMLSLLHSICHGFMWYSCLLVCLDYHSYMFFIMILAHTWYTTLLLYLFCLILVYMNMLIILLYSCEYIWCYAAIVYITMQLLFFGIKMCRKLSKSLTI